MFGTTKPFGTASTFGSSTFGATTSPFGGTNTFGAKPATSNVFGTSTFGATQPQAGGLFGTPPQNTGTGLFGQQSTAFGQPVSTSGGSFAFGGTPTTGGGLFGATTPATQQNTGLFGGSSTSAFGTPGPAFGGFGGTSTGTGLFGQNTSTGLFGSSGGFGATAPTGTTVKFNPPSGTDTMMKGGVSHNISTRHQCITCMKEYENKCLEELRLEDYSANRKGPQAGSTLGGFGAPTQTGLFGQPAASTSAFSFGATQAKSPFGATSGTNTFGTGTGLFGQTNQQQNTNLFGKPTGFGAVTTTSSAFNFGNTANTSLFGQNTQQKPLFGQSTPSTGLFGQPATTQTTGFGMNTGFGGFGTTAQPSTGLFGAKPTGFGTTNTTTTNTFTFGTSTGSTGLFGAKAPGTGFGTGTTFGTSTPFGGFGTNTGTTSLFGQTKPTLGFGQPGNTFGTTSLSSGFGTSPFTSTGLSTNTGLFGNSFANKPAGFNFGNTNTGFGGFGQTNPATNSFNFGGTAGAANINDPNAAAALLQQQIQAKQIFAFTANPFGDNPLFKNTIRDSKRREELLKPTNPAAQKAVLASNQFKVSPLPASRIKPKPITPIANGKVSLFDGLEDEEPNLGNETFVSRRSFKKLILKPNSQNNSAISSLNMSTPPQNSITGGLNFSSPGAFLNRISPSYTVDEQNAESSPLSPSPLTVFISDKKNNNSPDISLNKNASTSNSPLNDSSFSYNPPSSERDVHRNSSSDDTIAVLRSKPHLALSNESLNSFSEHDSVSFNKENINNSCKLHPAGIILERPEYYTIPSLEELAEMVDEDGNCYVDNFIIGRENYGKVRFKERVNLANLNLDEIVHFRKKEITVYPDDKCTPPLGEGLNTKAEITLEQVWPVDKTDRSKFIKDYDKLQEYKEKVKSATKTKMGAKFIDYVPETGTWIFEVEHFTKYGIEDSDDEDDEITHVKTLRQSAMPVLPPSFINGHDIVPPNVTVDRPPVQKKLRIGVTDNEIEMHDFDKNDEPVVPPFQHLMASKMDSNHIQKMKMSCFLDDVEGNDIDMKRTVPVFSVKETKSFLKPIPLKKFAPNSIKGFESPLQKSFSDPSHETITPGPSNTLMKYGKLLPKIQSPSPFSLKSPSMKSSPSIQSIINLQKSMTRKVRKLVLKPWEKSFMYGNENFIADIGFVHGRSFRVGWSSDMSFIHFPYAGNFEAVNPPQLLVSNVATQHNFSTQGSQSLSVALTKVEVLDDVKVDELIKQNLQKVFKVQLQYSESEFEDGCPIFIPKPGNEVLHAHAKLTEILLMDMDSSHPDKQFMKQCYNVWQLCVALWGEIPGFEMVPESSDYLHHMARKEALSSWLVKTSKEKVQREINNNGFDPERYLSTILSHLSIRQVAKAVHLAQEHRDHCMAKLIAQAEGNHYFRKFVIKQLKEWRENNACKLIRKERLKIYALMGGLLYWDFDSMIINCCENLDWKRSFSLHLWYLCIPTATIKDAVNEFVKNFEDSDNEKVYTRPPYPPYIDATFDSPTKDDDNDFSDCNLYDTCFHLLKLYCDKAHRLDKLLMPELSTTSSLDFRLSWFLHQALIAIQYRHLPQSVAHTLHVNFIAQLENMGLWYWAIFVALHTQNPQVRKNWVKDLLLRHVSLESSSVNEMNEHFLHSQLLIPKEWIFEAKAIRAHIFGHIADEAYYLLKAGFYSKSHQIVIKHLASDAIINENDDYLLTFLNELAPPERSSTILDWPSGGQIFLSYIYISQKVQSILEGKTDACQAEELWPELLSLVKRLSSLDCPTAKDRLCQSEMAKKTAILMRAVLPLKEGKPSVAYKLAPCMRNLPMPEDYAIQELRTLVCDYMLDLTSD